MAFDPTVITSVNVVRDDAELLITWTTTAPAGTLFQVYLDRARVWCGTALQCVLPWPVSRVTIDVGAVASNEGNVNFATTLPALTGTGDRAQLSWLGGTYLDANGHDDVKSFEVFGATVAGGSVSYTTLLATVLAYEQDVPADGFGVGGFGQGGFGKAASAYSWTSGPLSSGVWTFAVRTLDFAGNVTTGVTTTITISTAPRPPAAFSDGKRLHYTYNATSHVATLTWQASPT